MTTEGWFDDEADAKRYLGEVGRLWTVWLLGLGALVFSRGLTAGVVGLVLLVAMFILMSPLQNRVHDRYRDDEESHQVAKRQSLSARDRALRQLTYGRAPFGEAVDKRGLWFQDDSLGCDRGDSDRSRTRCGGLVRGLRSPASGLTFWAPEPGEMYANRT